MTRVGSTTSAALAMEVIAHLISHRTLASPKKHAAARCIQALHKLTAKASGKVPEGVF